MPASETASDLGLIAAPCCLKVVKNWKKIVDKNFSLLHKNQDTAAYFNSIERALASMDVTILHTNIAQEEGIPIATVFTKLKSSYPDPY